MGLNDEHASEDALYQVHTTIFYHGVSRGRVVRRHTLRDEYTDYPQETSLRGRALSSVLVV